MTPERARSFYARNWPARIWIVVFPALCVALMAVALGPPPELAGFKGDAKGYLLLLGLALLIGLCAAALLGPFLLGPLYHYRAERNGYPFHPDDRVELLVGANRGRVVRVVEVWDWRGDLRVDLGESARPGANTLFQFTQVVRVAEDAPPAVEQPELPAPPRISGK